MGGVACNVGCSAGRARHKFVAKLRAIRGVNVEFTNVCVGNVYVKTRSMETGHGQLARGSIHRAVYPER